jgi:multicomponent K+:H+ antiporter subunit D
VNLLLVLPVLLPLLSGAALLALARPALLPARIVSVASVTAQLAVAVALLTVAADGTIVSYAVGDWPAPFGITLVLDRLSALMLTLAALLAFFALLHALGGTDQKGAGFHALFQFQLLGLNGAFLTGDLFNLFVFFEILLIASYTLLLHGGGAARTRAGLHYVVLNLVGSALFLLAVGVLYGVLGTLNMADIALRVTTLPAENAVLIEAAALLLLTVFGLKAALVPLHFWLAPAYASATAPVAALFAIMTKVGAYAILRVYTLLPGTEWIAPWLLWGALITLLVAGVGLLASRDLRTQVAWLVLVSVGTLLAGVALFNSAGVGGALYYLVHTTLVSGGLFLLADLVGLQRREGSQLVSGEYPAARTWLGVLFLVGAAAAAGLPPTSGFLGKVLVMQAAFDTPVLPWMWTVILLGGLAALLALARAGSVVFWKSAQIPAVAPMSWLRSVPAAALVSAGLWLAVLGGPLAAYTAATAAQLLAPQQYVSAVLGEGGLAR